MLNIEDGYLHVAGIGGTGSNLGWRAEFGKQFAPRIGAAYQINEKTVIPCRLRTQLRYRRLRIDLRSYRYPEPPGLGQPTAHLANNNCSRIHAGSWGRRLQQSWPLLPTDWIPNPGSSVTSSARPDPLNFPTIDAWNLAIQRAITPTLTLTVAYVGNK